MYQKLLQIRLRKRKGNLLIIVLMSAIIISLLCGIVKKAAYDVSNANNQAKSVVDLYNGLTFADLFADAFFADIGSQYNQEVIEPGTIEFTPELYKEMISGADGFAENMHIEIQDDGTAAYVGSAQAVIETVTFDEHATITMKTQFKRIADRIESFYITMDSGFAVDDASENNILNGESGDRYYFEPIDFSLEFALGIQKYQQTYRISGLYAEFTMGEGIITCTVKNDEAWMALTGQRID